MCPPKYLIPGPFSYPHIKFHLPATRPISCFARRTHTSSARRPQDCVYITLCIAYIFYILCAVECQASFGPLNSFDAHELTLTPWRYIIDKAITGTAKGGTEGERDHIYWNCENQKFHSSSYKSVNVCHLSKSPPSHSLAYSLYSSLNYPHSLIRHSTSTLICIQIKDKHLEIHIFIPIAHDVRNEGMHHLCKG